MKKSLLAVAVCFAVLFVPMASAIALVNDTEGPQDAPIFVLTEGVPVHEELSRWCANAGWSFYWRPRISWRVMKTTSIVADNVVEAVSQVIETLRSEKRPVRIEVYHGNNVIEVVSTKVAIK